MPKFSTAFSSARVFASAGICAIGLCGSSSLAASYYVAGALGEGVHEEDARAMTSLVRTAVAARAADRPVDDEWRAEYVLQPRLTRLGDDFILTVEKRRGTSVLAVGKAKAARLEELDSAARWAVEAALDRPISRPLDPTLDPARTPAPIVSGATTPEFDSSSSAAAAPVPMLDAQAVTRAQAARAFESQRRKERWNVGFGPFAGRHLQNDNALYGFSGGHSWEIHPQASVKVFGEGAFSSGKDSSRFIDFGVGANYYWPTANDSMPYLTGDLGYGFARTSQAGDDSEGVSVGVGVGYHFWRFAERNLDLQLRYATITDAVRDGSYPGILGARAAVNF